MMMNNSILRAAAIAAILFAGSCAGPREGFNSDPAVNHPIAVEPHFTSIKMNFSGKDAGLLPDDSERLDAFVADYLSRGSGSISVSAPSGSDATAALNYFGTRLFSMGVPRSRILVGTHEGADQRVEVGFIAYTASTKECGDWSSSVAYTESNRPMRNFGCAVQANIAAQVADPRDLVEMRPSDPSDAARRATVIDNYEQGRVTGAQKSGEQSAAIAGVDK